MEIGKGLVFLSAYKVGIMKNALHSVSAILPTVLLFPVIVEGNQYSRTFCNVTLAIFDSQFCDWFLSNALIKIL